MDSTCTHMDIFLFAVHICFPAEDDNYSVNHTVSVEV